MSLGLTVVTHTKSAQSRDISKCIESVRRALPAGARHAIIEHDGDFNDFLTARYNSMNLDDVVVFVDDDDYISEDSLALCMAALTANDVGIAFTREVKVMENGNYRTNLKPALYSDMCNHPQTVHHMTAYRTKYVSERSLILSLKYRCGIEWIMRVDAALSAGAIFIPTDGYYWVQHELQNHKITEIQDRFKNNLDRISEELRTWIKIDSEVPTFGEYNAD